MIKIERYNIPAFKWVCPCGHINIETYRPTESICCAGCYTATMNYTVELNPEKSPQE